MEVSFDGGQMTVVGLLALPDIVGTVNPIKIICCPGLKDLTGFQIFK